MSLVPFTSLVPSSICHDGPVSDEPGQASQPTHDLLGGLWIDCVFLLGKGQHSNADCQSYWGNRQSAFSLFPPGIQDDLSPADLLRALLQRCRQHSLL
jgi:hypothetical protein